MKVIAVIGSKKSGKTMTIEALIRGLTEKGYTVATVKHVSEKGFTIDTPGKDTWRHAQAGAKTIIIVAPDELSMIRKGNTKKLDLQEILAYFSKDVDFVILEGFRSMVENKTNIPKIVAIKTLEEAVAASTRFKPTIAFTGKAASTVPHLGIPVVNILKESEKLVEIVLSCQNHYDAFIKKT